MDRRHFLAAAAALAVLPLALPRAARAQALPRVTVAKSPTCGCCGAWVDHMRASGFEVTVQEVEQDALDGLKQMVGLPADFASCHTATVGGYFVEGHVPADDVKRLLAEKPQARGLTVPGMPAGSPGMEMGSQKDPYDTILIAADGSPSVFARHRD